MSEIWNIVSAGPSREHLRREHLLEGPVVTVNRAIDITARGFPVDFAAFSDSPSGCWEQCKLERFWKPGIQLWVGLRPLPIKVRPQGFSNDVVIPYGGNPVLFVWDERLPLGIGLRVLPDGFQEDWQRPGVRRHAFTLLCVLKKVWTFKPKQVRILCADMKGSWIEGKTEEECDAHDQARQKLDRWLHERKSLQAELKRARKDGITVELVVPEPEHSLTEVDLEC